MRIIKALCIILVCSALVGCGKEKEIMQNPSMIVQDKNDNLKVESESDKIQGQPVAAETEEIPDSLKMYEDFLNGKEKLYTDRCNATFYTVENGITNNSM